MPGALADLVLRGRLVGVDAGVEDGVEDGDDDGHEAQRYELAGEA